MRQDTHEIPDLKKTMRVVHAGKGQKRCREGLAPNRWKKPAAHNAIDVYLGEAGRYFGRTKRNLFGRLDRSLLNQAFGGTALKKSRGQPSPYKPKS